MHRLVFVIVKKVDDGEVERLMNPFHGDTGFGWSVEWCYGGRWDGMLQGINFNEYPHDPYGGNPFDRNMLGKYPVRVSTIRDNYATVEDALANGWIPSVIVTPDGKWYAEDQDTYQPEFYYVDGELIELSPKMSWEDQIKELLRRYPNHFVVCCDSLDN